MAFEPGTTTPTLARESAAPADSSGRVIDPLRSRTLVLAFAILLLSQPHTLRMTLPPLWLPAAGVSFVLVAWFGWRWAIVSLVAGAVVAAIASATGADAPVIVGAMADGAIAGLEGVVGAWLFLQIAAGARRLSDPRSAVEFLLLVPGLTAALGAAFGLALARAAGASPSFTALWLGHALGLLVVAPPFLVCLTPWLVRRGLTHEDSSTTEPLLPGPVGADRLTFGDGIEIAGLALCAGGLGLLLALAPGSRVLAGWQVWGAPLLLIVWASLRQGLAGGTTVACVAVGVPLAVLAAELTPIPLGLLLQGNLLAQAATGLLVAASASWLRSSERRYRQLVARVPIVVYSVRLTGNPPAAEVTLVSAAGGELLGAPPDQFLGEHARWLQHVHPDDREVLQAAIIQLQRQQRPVSCEYRLAPVIPADWSAVSDPSAPRSRVVSTVAGRSAGGIRWVRDTLAPRRNADGKVIGWEGVVSDVTEQRTLADDLRRTSRMLHALVDNLPAGVFFVQGPQGTPILVNARARQLLGQREDASLAHLASVYRLHRADRTAYPNDELPVTRALRDGRSTMCDDIVVHRPDGRRVPLVTWAAPVHLSGAAPDGAVWVLQDLTVLQQAESARHESEGRLRAAVEAMGEALLVLNSKGEVVDSNSAAGKLFAGEGGALSCRSLAELGGRWLREDGSPLADGDNPAAITLRTGRPVRGAVIGLQRGSGAIRWLLVNAMPLGTPAAGVVTTFSDLTRYHQSRKSALAMQ